MDLQVPHSKAVPNLFTFHVPAPSRGLKACTGAEDFQGKLVRQPTRGSGFP